MKYQQIPNNPLRHEFLDDTPVAKPLKWNRPGSTLTEIRRNLGLLSKLAEQNGTETFDEADDFDVGDDFDPTDTKTPWEIAADAAVLSRRELLQAVTGADEASIDAALAPRAANPTPPAPSAGNNPPISGAPVPPSNAPST